MALRERIAAATPNNPRAKGPSEGRYEVLESLGDPPRFEAWPSSYLRYLAKAPLSTSEFISQTGFVSSIDAISRWLASHGIDLIFVPVPKMTEVYPDQFIRETPADRIVAPPMRRAIHDLLDRGVEVVDLLPVFLEARKKKGPSLYQYCDPHWTWEGQRIALEEIVKRLRRYPVVRKAQSGPRLYRSWTERRDLTAVSAALGALTAEQATRVKPLLTYDVELVAAARQGPSHLGDLARRPGRRQLQQRSRGEPLPSAQPSHPRPPRLRILFSLQGPAARPGIDEVHQGPDLSGLDSGPLGVPHEAPRRDREVRGRACREVTRARAPDALTRSTR